MSMEDAMLLAKHIETNVPGIDVMAIGRFVKPENINHCTPWRISVAVLGVDDSYKMIDSEESLRSLVQWANDQKQEIQAGMLF